MIGGFRVPAPMHEMLTFVDIGGLRPRGRARGGGGGVGMGATGAWRGSSGHDPHGEFRGIQYSRIPGDTNSGGHNTQFRGTQYSIQDTHPSQLSKSCCPARRTGRPGNQAAWSQSRIVSGCS